MLTVARGVKHRAVMGTLVAILIIPAIATAQLYFTQPQPGDVYKEYTTAMGYGEEWRVTDPNAGDSRAQQFLPNAVIYTNIDDLSGAVRAEAVMSIWGGHIYTTGKKVRFNSNSWINIPELGAINGVPNGTGHHYLNQVMVTVDVPLAHLQQGTNSFEGTNEGQIDGGWNWGQHGWYVMMVRVYYGSGKSHTTGTISSVSSGGTLTENPTLAVNLSGGASRVDYLAYYDGYDTDGDGIYSEYHHDYHTLVRAPTGVYIYNNAASATSAPFSASWNTQWVPDQPAGSVKLLARIKGDNGVWYVTPEVTNLSLVRTGRSVKFYKNQGIQEHNWAWGGATITSTFSIPAGHNLADMNAAVYHHRSWNGSDEVWEPGDVVDHFWKVNNWNDSQYGANHHYSYDVRTIPGGVLQSGTNTVSFYSANRNHHGMEILYPGPALMVEYTGGGYASPVPGTATLASPANGAPNQTPTLTLRWRPAAAASTYEVQLSPDSTFNTGVQSFSGIADTSKQVGPLANLTKYFWRVRGNNSAGAGSWSSAWSFTTYVAAPTLRSPANAATNQPVSLTLVWGAVPTATAYRLQVATASNFGAGSIVKDTTLADTSKVVAGLQYSTQYYWHVAAQTGGAWGDYSSAWSFTTVVAPAGVPSLMSPAHNATNVLTTTVLLWHSAANATAYHLQFGTNSSFTSGVIVDDSTLTDTTRNVTGLSYNTVYYWRVRAKNAGGYSAYSSTNQFTTVMAVPTAPLQLTPANGAINQATSLLTFRWMSLEGATHYRFMLASDSTFASGIIKNDSTVTDTFRIVSGLAQSTRYFWRVAGRNAGGPGPFSPTWAFTTLIPLPGQVSLLAPAHQATLGGDTARCTWSETTPPSTRYWFEISIDSTFGAFTSRDSLLTSPTKLVQSLLNNTTYYWRVRGGNEGGWGPFSERRQFSVVITSVAMEREIPTDFQLRQNFPNPFNPSTRIEFGVPKESRVKLEVYNLLGQLVATVVDETRSPGYHAVQFAAADLPSGIYLYRLTADGVSLLRKMVLLK